MISNKVAVLAASGMLAALAAAPAAAQLGMGLIGEGVVNGADRDTIPARGGAQYRELMICVENAPVAFQEVVVRYRGGGAQTLRLRARIRAGGCSRILDLVGRDRDIQAVELGYAPAAPAAPTGSARPAVQLYAR